jgi:iron complex transport system substrate-binding protein
MGEGGRVVGISDWCHYPPESQDRQRCGGAAGPNFEAVVGLHPDLVIVLGKSAKMADFCNERSIPLLRVAMNSVAEIQTDLLSIGEALGASGPARALADRITQELAAVKSDLPAERRPRVFLCLSRPPGAVGSLMTAGGGTFLDEVATLAGGRSIFADLKEYPTVSKETLVMRAPDVIVELRPEEAIGSERARELDADWAPLSSLPAVRDGRIVYITQGFVLQPGPRVAETVRILKRALGTDSADAGPKGPTP